MKKGVSLMPCNVYCLLQLTSLSSLPPLVVIFVHSDDTADLKKTYCTVVLIQ